TRGKWERLPGPAGAGESHRGFAPPPIQWPCYYGIDTPTRKELIGSSHRVEEIRRYTGADSLGYLSLDGMLKALGGDGGRFCHACFTVASAAGFPPENTAQLALFAAVEAEREGVGPAPPIGTRRRSGGGIAGRARVSRAGPKVGRPVGGSLSYRRAGVDIGAGEEAVRRLAPWARATYRPEVLSDIG